MLQTILILIGGLFGVFFICLIDVELKLRNKKELFRANLVSNCMSVSAFISLACIFVAVILA